ncbi:MAG: shikimate dehydrogenase [Bacteroidota bacterium]|jgi:shikimate dehydrogenase
MLNDYKEFGLIGNNLKNSFSKNYFSELFFQNNFNYKYFNFELENINELPLLIKNNVHLTGINVTIPFKESVLQFLNKIDTTAQEINAVNCIKIERSLSKIYLTGYNTDAFGFEKALKQFLPLNFKPKALVLGNGGASKAIQFILKKMQLDFTLVSTQNNNFCIQYEHLNETIFKEHLLVINTTPLGMKPREEQYPSIPYQLINSNHYCFDLIYFPNQTLFLKLCAAKGAKTTNGLYMLKEQANKAFEIFIK